MSPPTTPIDPTRPITRWSPAGSCPSNRHRPPLARTSPSRHRIVVVDERRKSNGRSLELVGTYDPRCAPEKLVIKTERVSAWQASYLGAAP